jgi:Zn-dependent membrane protease YugP
MDIYVLSWIIIIPAFLFALYAQFLVKSTFSKYAKIGSTNGLTGADAARMILEKNGILDVTVQPGQGRLTDNYDPGKRVISLSQDVFGSTSIAAIGVAAHESGHAIQHAENYSAVGLRTALFPAAGIGSQFGPYMAIFGLIINQQWLVTLGLMFFGIAVLFYLVTLPVEFNASHRAVDILQSSGILNPDETAGAAKVLRAAAMTYVASAAVAMASFLRLILLSNSRRRY